jgi:hypothetical protein
MPLWKVWENGLWQIVEGIGFVSHSHCGHRVFLASEESGLLRTGISGDHRGDFKPVFPVLQIGWTGFLKPDMDVRA